MYSVYTCTCIASFQAPPPKGKRWSLGTRLSCRQVSDKHIYSLMYILRVSPYDMKIHCTYMQCTCTCALIKWCVILTVHMLLYDAADS